MDNTEHVVFAIQFNLWKKSAIFNIKLRYQTVRIGHPPPTPSNPDHTHTMYYLAIFFLGRGLQYWKSTVLQTFRYLYNLVSMYNIWGELGAQWSHFFFVYNVRAGLQQVFTVNLYVFIISRYFQRRMARGHHPWWPLSTLAI